MALTTIGQVLHGEVVGRNECKGSVRLELDTGEFAHLPAGRMVTAFDDLTDGTEVKVLVVAERQDRSYRSYFIVSERLDDELELPEPEEGDFSKPGVASPELVKQYPVGMRVTGKVKSVNGKAILVVIDQQVAFLPFTELGACKPGSFRPGTNVKAFVLVVDAGGVMLTKNELSLGGKAA